MLVFILGSKVGFLLSREILMRNEKRHEAIDNSAILGLEGE